MKSLFAKTQFFFSFSKNMFFIILSCLYCASLLPPTLFFNLVKITQLQFDWDELECTMKKHDYWQSLTLNNNYPFLQMNSSHVKIVCGNNYNPTHTAKPATLLGPTY